MSSYYHRSQSEDLLTLTFPLLREHKLRVFGKITMKETSLLSLISAPPLFLSNFQIGIKLIFLEVLLNIEFQSLGDDKLDVGNSGTGTGVLLL